MEQTSLELLDAWHQGDNEALVVLVERQATWLRKYVRRRMSAKMRMFETSEDVVQTVLLNLLRFGPAFRPATEIQFRALIAKCVYNRLCELHDYATAQLRDPSRVEAFPSAVSRIGACAASSDRPDRLASESEDRGFVALALQLVDPEDSRLIRWHDFEGVEFAEIGERLSMSEEGARSRYRRALARVRVEVERLKSGRLEDLEREIEEYEPQDSKAPS